MKSTPPQPQQQPPSHNHPPTRFFLNPQSKKKIQNINTIIINTSFDSKNKKSGNKENSQHKLVWNNNNCNNYSVKQFKINKSHQSSLNTSENKEAWKKNKDEQRQRSKDEKIRNLQKSKLILKSSNMITNSSKIKDQNCTSSQNFIHKNRIPLQGIPPNKLYTFCEQVIKSNQLLSKLNQSISQNIKQTKDTEFQSQHLTNDDSNRSTIIVKQQQLKRFTQKFARQKIQFEQTLQILLHQLHELKSINSNLINQKNNYTTRAESYELTILTLQEQLQLLTEKLRINQLTSKQNLYQFEQILKDKTTQISNLSEIITQKQIKIQQIVHELEKRQRQLEKNQYEQNQSKIIFPLSNINHISSINSQAYTQSPPKQLLLEQLQYLRQQCTNYQTQHLQMNKSLAYLKIENEHLIRELDLEKQTTANLREEINQIKNQINGHSPHRDRIGKLETNVQEFSGSCSTEQENERQMRTQMAELISQNTTLEHNKKTLLRSLKVSSEMIIHLKQQAHQHKLKYQNEIKKKLSEIRKDNKEITTDHIKIVVRSMMKQQLQLEQKLKIVLQAEQSQQKTQSIPQKKSFQKECENIKSNICKKINHYKTQKDSQKDCQSNQKESFMEGYFIYEPNENYSLNSYHNFMENKLNFSSSRTFL